MKLPILLFATTATAFALPAVGPDYQRPETPAAAAWRDADALGWKAGEPADALARGEWWKLFADATLDDLVARALAANQDLHAAAARVEEARAGTGVARSAYWPQIGADLSVQRAQGSLTTPNSPPDHLTTTYRAPLVASWELDLFGRVRRLNEGARAEAEASVATFEAVRLSLTAEVAVNYFSLRALDQEAALIADGVKLRQQALDLVTSRRKSGAATDFDVARAETELALTQADAAATARHRAALQNALAVLVGEPALSFHLAPAIAPLAALQPAVPAGLPSELLERRPDIAAAERALAAANARIGVAKAAFFPALSLTGGAGYASGDIDRLFTADSRTWAFGPSLYLPIFQGGRNRANLERSRAAYEASVAVYRQSVLVAFREVQDALTGTRLLAEQSAAQDRAVEAARRAGALAQKRYDAGFVNYFEVIDAQRTVLSAERIAAQLAAQRLSNSVTLIKALGGGWNAAPATVAAR
jgi:multidrug efflux system outer membrane protein